MGEVSEVDVAPVVEIADRHISGENILSGIFHKRYLCGLDFVCLAVFHFVYVHHQRIAFPHGEVILHGVIWIPEWFLVSGDSVIADILMVD